MKCINCQKSVPFTEYYNKTNNRGPLYFIANTVKGPEYFYPNRDSLLCDAKCAEKYRHKQSILEV